MSVCRKNMNMQTRRGWTRAGLATTVLILSACSIVTGYVRGRSSEIAALESFAVPHSPAALGQIRFVFDDMGGLSTRTLDTVALPWKLASTALLLDHTARTGASLDRSQLPTVLQRFGFVVPERIGNWAGPAPAPKFDRPIGILTGYIASVFPRIRLEVANLGCAACHGGVTYDREGLPRREVWIGLPNTSLNLEAYTQAVYRSVKSAMDHPDRLLAAVQAVYSETSPEEMETFRAFVLPRLAERLAKLARGLDRPLPFDNGAPGLTNGIASLKFHLGVIPGDRPAEEFGFVSIPDIGGTTLRTSLLADGFYGVPGKSRFQAVSVDNARPVSKDELAQIVAFFTVPAFGTSPEEAEGIVPRVRDIVEFIDSYVPPPFPGAVHRRRADRGRGVYAAHCSGCHGTYSDDPDRPRLLDFPNRLVPQAEMGTDPTRWQSADQTLAAAINRSAFGNRIAPRQTRGYVAPALTGIWATAPYLHNGSVPTLWHLMHPKRRPAAFLVGGHRLDFARVGIAGSPGPGGVMVYPESYRPWAEPTVYETRAPGRSNSGHEWPFDRLSDADKDALREFLKLL